MFLTLLKVVGTARSLLTLFIFVAVLFGIPLVLLALRLFEELSEKRREKAKRSRDESMNEPTDASMNDATQARRVISTNTMKNA